MAAVSDDLTDSDRAVIEGARRVSPERWPAYAEYLGRLNASGKLSAAALAVLDVPLPAMADPPVPPSLADRVGNARKAAGRVGAAIANREKVLAAAAVVAERKAACATCDKSSPLWCKACGCLLAAKQRLATEDCPLGLWSKPAA